MGFFDNQFSNVVEWQEFNQNQIFYKWNNDEIKKGSRLIIRPGQDAIFLYNGKIEGIFKDEGSFDIESEIIPFLSTLKGLKFGFNSGIRAEVVFINTKEFQAKWGTKNAISVPAQGLPGGLPIRANGTVNFKINDYLALIDNVAGIKKTFEVEDVKERIMSIINQLLMKWISKEGKDMFNLQANSFEISKGITDDLNMQLNSIGVKITSFNVMSFNYPEEIQKMANKAAGQYMVGDMNKYQQIAFADSLEKGGNGSQMAQMMAGMAMGQQMVQQMNSQQTQYKSNGQIPNFCPNCGNKTNGMNFCGNCGFKLV